MLPEFPWFKQIDLSDRQVVEEMIAGYPPFADFNFVELWCWNRGQEGGIAALDGNLVVRWQDVVTGDLFLSFLGTNKVERTASKLIAYAKERGIEPRLQAVPDVVVEGNPAFGSGLVIEEDTLNSDYLLSVNDWAEMAGSKFKNKRNAVHRLERNHAPEFRRLDLHDAAVREDMMQLCYTWAEQKGRGAEETQPEFDAIANLLTLAQELSLDRLRVFGVYSDEKLIGFSVNEILPDGYALGHFAKGDYRYEGVYPYMLRGVCSHLRENGVEYINIEADLGDPGLAASKQMCNPQGRLKKYVIAEAAEEPAPPIRHLPQVATWDERRSA